MGGRSPREEEGVTSLGEGVTSQGEGEEENDVTMGDVVGMRGEGRQGCPGREITWLEIM